MRLIFLIKAVLTLAFCNVFSYSICQPARFPQKICATADHALPWLREFQNNAFVYPRSNELLLVPIAIHLVGDDSGQKMIPEHKVLDAFCTLNRHFEAAGIQFVLKQAINRINNSAYHNHQSGAVGLMMMNMHNVPGAVNTYFVHNAVDACGYTLRDLSGLGIGITLSADCTGQHSSTWTHEMGHFFSLPHTFNGWEREQPNFSVSAPSRIGNLLTERADGSNCSQAGDGFCDTRADYLNGRWFCDPQSNSQILQLDPAGTPFRSDGTLFMSYAADPCPNRFSPMQTEAMRTHLRFIRIDLQRPVAMSLDLSLRSEVELTIPANASFIPGFQEIPLSWKNVAGADFYLVELSPLPSFPFLSNSYMTRDTSILLRDLKPARTYFWRIRPFNTRSTCRLYSPVRSFSTGTVTNLKETIAESPTLQIFPNPVPIGQPFLVRFYSEKTATASFELMDIMGRTMHSGIWALSTGENSLLLDQIPIEPGMYLLRLRVAGKTITGKILIGP